MNKIIKSFFVVAGIIFLVPGIYHLVSVLEKPPTLNDIAIITNLFVAYWCIYFGTKK